MCVLPGQQEKGMKTERGMEILNENQTVTLLAVGIEGESAASIVVQIVG